MRHKNANCDADIVEQWCRVIKHFDFLKLVGLWLAGQVVNHAGIY